MKYCPQCGSEYRPGFERCPDCQQDLVDEPPSLELKDEPIDEWDLEAREEVFISGRRLDAELARGRLDADGIDARIWGGGMGVWRMESALTEMTGVPNAFNSYRVVVPEEDAARARQILEQDHRSAMTGPDEDEQPVGGLEPFRVRWVLVAAALFLLAVILFGGGPLD